MAVRLSSAAAGGVAVLGTVIDPSGAKKGAKETTDAMQGIGDQAKKSGKVWVDAHGKMRDSSDKSASGTRKNQSSIGNAFDNSTKKLAKLVAGYASFQALISSVRHIRDSTVAMESIVAGLTFVTGSSELAAKEVANLRSETDRLGLIFERTAKGFIDVAAAARATTLEGEGVREIFLGVSEAAAVLSLSQDRVDRTFLALQQTISRGVLSMEEMHQLSEAIPGALSLAERAVGKFGAEFISSVEKRMIDGKDFALAFARTMREDFSGAVESSTTRSAASFARLKNAIFELSVAAGKSGLIDVMTLVAEGLTFWAKLAREAAIATGLLTVSVSELNRSELESRLVEERERFHELEQGVAAYNGELRKIIETRKNLMAISGGDPSAYVPTIIDREAAAVRSGFDIDAWRESRKEIERLENAIDKSVEAERRLAEARETLANSTGAATAATKTLSTAVVSLTEDERNHVQAFVSMARDEADAWGSIKQAIKDVKIEELNREQEVAAAMRQRLEYVADAERETLDQLDRRHESMLESYEDLASGIGDVLVGIATDTSTSVESMASDMLRTFAGMVRQMEAAGADSNLLAALGSGATGAITGLSIGGLPGAAGGAVGGWLGGLGGTAIAGQLISGMTQAAVVAWGGFIGSVVPVVGTAVGSVLGGLVGSLFGGRDEPKIPQAFFQQANALTDPFGAGTNPQTVSPFGRFLVQMMDLGETPVPQEFMDTLNQIVETIGVLDTALADALGPERTGQIAAALEDVHELGGGEIDEIQLEQIMRRRFEIIFEAIGGEMEETFLRMAEGLDTGAMADLAITLAQIFTAFERGEQVFADIEGPVNTVNALLEHFSRQNETLSGTLQRLAVSMGLVTSLGLDHLEASTGFARFAENFVDALGGMDAAIAQTSAFNRIFGATPSGLLARGEASVQQVETAFDAAGIPFSPGMIPTLDEFNRAFMEIQASVDAADLAAWVEAGLALAGLHEILAQMPEPAREAADAVGEAADAIEDIIEEATVNVGAIVGTLEQLRQGEIERGMTDLEVSIHRQRESTLALVEQMQEWGAAEAELTYVRVQGAIAVQDLLDAELERARLAAEAEEERARAESARLNEERARTIAEADAAAARAAEEAAAAEAARQSGIADILAAVADEGLVRNLSDYELALRRLSARYQDRVGDLRELDASEEALSLVRSNHLAAVRALADAEALLVAQEEERAKIEAERAIAEAAQVEEDRLRSIEGIMSGINRAAEEMGLSDLELAILRVRRETDATVASLFDLEASAGDIARAIELGERRILEIRKDALNQELALIESLSQSIDGSIGGLIESIAATTRTDEENYDHLRLQAEALAATLGTMTDPAQIENTIREIERLTSAAWGLQGDQPRAAQDFIEFLEGVREISMAQLENARDIAATRAGIDQAFAESLDTAGPLFADAADSLAQDAETISGAADKFSKAVDRFSETARRPIVVETGGAGIVNA